MMRPGSLSRAACLVAVLTAVLSAPATAQFQKPYEIVPITDDIFAIVERTPNEQRRFSLWQLSVKGEICEDLNDDEFNHTANA